MLDSNICFQILGFTLIDINIVMIFILEQYCVLINCYSIITVSVTVCLFQHATQIIIHKISLFQEPLIQTLSTISSQPRQINGLPTVVLFTNHSPLPIIGSAGGPEYCWATSSARALRRYRSTASRTTRTIGNSNRYHIVTIYSATDCNASLLPYRNRKPTCWRTRATTENASQSLSELNPLLRYFLSSIRTKLVELRSGWTAERLSMSTWPASQRAFCGWACALVY